MNLFQKLPGFVRTPAGREQQIWRRLPAILLWGTVLPLAAAAAGHLLAAPAEASGAAERSLRLWDFVMFGLVMTHWTLVLTVALGCFIVRVMKGPAYVADAYPLPPELGEETAREQGPQA